MSERFDILKRAGNISTKGLILKNEEAATGINMYGLAATGFKRKLRDENGQCIIALPSSEQEVFVTANDGGVITVDMTTILVSSTVYHADQTI